MRKPAGFAGQGLQLKFDRLRQRRRKPKRDEFAFHKADEHGQTAAEYAAVLVFVAAVVIVTVQLFGGQVAVLYDRVLAAFK